ncbi:MAG: hypothetical protein DSM106950_13995 [Stigonema ocellatum SAG 48.90 = DSM 106950]|nr:hypothetical protein [Stigonema ocellatum SAG 48.90 = DSM 106950]
MIACKDLLRQLGKLGDRPSKTLSTEARSLKFISRFKSRAVNAAMLIAFLKLLGQKERSHLYKRNISRFKPLFP